MMTHLTAQDVSLAKDRYFPTPIHRPASAASHSTEIVRPYGFFLARES
jgi:hypothetical protein